MRADVWTGVQALAVDGAVVAGTKHRVPGLWIAGSMATHGDSTMAMTRRLWPILVLVSCLPAQQPQLFATLDGPIMHGGTAAYDRHRDRAVFFGRDGAVWERSGNRLLQRANLAGSGPSERPVGRWRHSMVYDSLRKRVILFGGSGVTDLNDTWSWDGFRWERHAAQFGPLRRYLAAMAYDAASDQVPLAPFLYPSPIKFLILLKVIS